MQPDELRLQPPAGTVADLGASSGRDAGNERDDGLQERGALGPALRSRAEPGRFGAYLEPSRPQRRINADQSARPAVVVVVEAIVGAGVVVKLRPSRLQRVVVEARRRPSVAQHGSAGTDEKSTTQLGGNAHPGGAAELDLGIVRLAPAAEIRCRPGGIAGVVAGDAELAGEEGAGGVLREGAVRGERPHGRPRERLGVDLVPLPDRREEATDPAIAPCVSRAQPAASGPLRYSSLPVTTSAAKSGSVAQLATRWMVARRIYQSEYSTAGGRRRTVSTAVGDGSGRSAPTRRPSSDGPGPCAAAAEAVTTRAKSKRAMRPGIGERQGLMGVRSDTTHSHAGLVPRRGAHTARGKSCAAKRLASRVRLSLAPSSAQRIAHRAADCTG